METVNIYEAKRHFSRLVAAAAEGETIIIGNAGKPVAKLVRVEAPDIPRRLGFLEGSAQVPADFDSMGDDEVQRGFEGW